MQEKLNEIDTLNWQNQEAKNQLKWWVRRSEQIADLNIGLIYRHILDALSAMYPEDKKTITIFRGGSIKKSAKARSSSNAKRMVMSYEKGGTALEAEINDRSCDGCIQIMEGKEREKWLAARNPKELYEILKVKSAKDIEASRRKMLIETWRIAKGEPEKGYTLSSIIRDLTKEIFPELRK